MVNVEHAKPLKQVMPLLTLPVNICSSGGSTRCFPSRRLLVIRTNQLELIVIAYLHHNRIQGCRLKTLAPRVELLKKVLVAGMQGPKKEHQQKNRWGGDLALHRIVDHPIEVQTKGQIFLGVGHAVIEQRHECGESIRNGIRSAVVVQCIHHLEALPIILGPLILRQEAKRTVLNFDGYLALPKAASFQILGIGDEGVICLLS
jgi:hypothetical protein